MNETENLHAIRNFLRKMERIGYKINQCPTTMGTTIAAGQKTEFLSKMAQYPGYYICAFRMEFDTHNLRLWYTIQSMQASNIGGRLLEIVNFKDLGKALTVLDKYK